MKNQQGHNRGNGAFGPLYTPAEDAFLQANYVTRGAKACAADLKRSWRSVVKRASSLGLRRLNPWTAKDDDMLRILWGPHTIPQISRKTGRTEQAIYARARIIGLGLGCPQGYEYLTAASKRSGFAEAQLRRILRWAGVNIYRTMSRPGGATSTRHLSHMVEPHEVDEAVERWCATEPLQTAARRHGYEGSVLRLLVERAQAAGDTRLAPPPRKSRGHWRLDSKVVDELFAEYARLETMKSAAERHRVHVRTMFAWLSAAGLVHQRGMKLDPARVDAIVAARSELETMQSAAKRHGRSHPYVRDIIEQAIRTGDLTAPAKAKGTRWLLPPETYDRLIAKHIAGESGRRVLPRPRHIKSAGASALARVA